MEFEGCLNFCVAGKWVAVGKAAWGGMRVWRKAFSLRAILLNCDKIYITLNLPL